MSPDTSSKGVSFSPLVTQGTQVYLRPVTPQDYPGLRMADLSPQLGARWRFRGATPTPEQWVQANQPMLAQFLVFSTARNEALGVVSAYQQNFQDQHAHVAVASSRDEDRSPLLLLGAALFVEYLFRGWNFRKLYFELPEFNLPRVAHGLNRVLVEEGRLREDLYYDGRFWDRVILALYRTTWEAWSPRALQAVMTPSRRTGVVQSKL